MARFQPRTDGGVVSSGRTWIEGDIIAKPATNCRQTVKLGISGFAAARLADALRSSSDALDFFDVA
jgi:hypothetical protein